MGHVVFTPNHMTAEELHDGVRRMYHEFYQLPCTVRRMVRGLRLGVYPFFAIVVRNFVAMIVSRRRS